MALINGNDNANVLQGTIFGDIIRGFGGNDQIDGKSGADILDGGTGDDFVDGGNGDDVLLVRNGDLAASETYFGGFGTDELRLLSGGVAGPFIADFTLWGFSSVERVAFLSTATVPITAKFAASQLGGGDLAADLEIVGGSGIDTLEFQMLDEINLDLRGLSFSNWGPNDQVVITGVGSAIFGSAVAEFFDFGFGLGTVEAGGGDDVIVAGGFRTYSGGLGFDTILHRLSIDMTLSEFESIESLSFDFSLSVGSRTFEYGADQFGGGQISSSVLIKSIDPSPDILRIEMADETVFAAGGFTFDGFGSNDRIEIIGDNDAESITGSTHHDLIDAAGGNDILAGGDGNDVLIGGVGNDTMFGGAGNDTYFVETADDDVIEFVLFTGADTGGTDTVRSTVDFTLGAFVENLVLLQFGAGDIDGTGNGLANVITGNGGANVLIGLGAGDRLFGNDGVDQLFGGLGNDRLEGGGDDDFLRGGGGNDTYVYGLGDGVDIILDASGNADRLVVDSFDDIVNSVRIGDDLELTFSDGGKVTITDHFLAVNRVENLVDASGDVLVLADGFIGGSGSGIISGTDGADYLNGKDGNDLLFGAGGDDLLVGGRGRDQLRGGTGDDALLGKGGSDTFIFAAGEGEDIVYDFVSSVDWIAFDSDSFGFSPAAGVAQVVDIGGPAPTDGASIYISGGTILFDDDWSDAAGQEELGFIVAGDPELGDVILI